MKNDISPWVSRRAFGQSALSLGLLVATPSIALATIGGTPDLPGYALGLGPDGRCDDAKIGGPVVRWDPGQEQWLMWYYCRDSEFPKDIAPAFGDGRIAHARSSDGLNWTRVDGSEFGGAVMAPSDDMGAFDALHIGSGDVRWSEEGWVLFYFGGENSQIDEIGGVAVPPSYKGRGYRMRPGIAKSSDGVGWTRVEGKGPKGAAVDCPEGALYASFPSAVRDGDRWLLYAGVLFPDEFFWHTYVYESTDLVDWRPLGKLAYTKPLASWEGGGNVTRNIIRNPGPGPRWLMSYVAVDMTSKFFARRVGAAVSDDAVNWTQLFDDPILDVGAPGSWDSGGVTYPQFIPVGDQMRLYFYGYANFFEELPEISSGIGLAVAPIDDLSNFTRVKDRSQIVC